MRIFFTLSLFIALSLAGFSQTGSPQVNLVKFYPNPAITQITFDFPKQYDQSFSFEIFNFLGKKVFELKNISPRTTVDLSQYFRGIYIFQLRDRNGKIVESGRFQVSK